MSNIFAEHHKVKAEDGVDVINEWEYRRKTARRTNGRSKVRVCLCAAMWEDTSISAELLVSSCPCSTKSILPPPPIRFTHTNVHKQHKTNHQRA